MMNEENIRNKETVYLALLKRLVRDYAQKDNKAFEYVIKDLKSINSIGYQEWVKLCSLVNSMKLGNVQKSNLLIKHLHSEVMKFWISQIIDKGEFKEIRGLVREFINTIIEIELTVSNSISMQNIEMRELMLQYIIKSINRKKSIENNDLYFYYIQIKNQFDEESNSENNNYEESSYKVVLNVEDAKYILNNNKSPFDSLNKNDLISGLFCYLINKKVKEMD
jgi:hypothetical protein